VRLLVPVALLAAACSQPGPRQVAQAGLVEAEGPSDRQVATLGMDDSRRFLPNTVRAVPGTITLTVENRGHLAHNLVFDDKDLGRTAMIDGTSSATLTVKVDRPGTYTFVCTPHRGMEGQLIVTRA